MWRTSHRKELDTLFHRHTGMSVETVKRGGRKRELEEKGGMDKGEERQSETKGGRHSRGKAGHQICNWPERAPELAETGCKESDGWP